jgi:hypothetical protein
MKMKPLVKANTVTSFFTASGPEVPIALWTSVSPIQMPNHTVNGPRPKPWNRAKKRKRKSTLSLKQWRHFTPFVYSVDGLLQCEANTFVKCLAANLAQKWKQSYWQQTCGYVNAWLSISIIRVTHICLQHGSHIPTSKISNQLPQWEDGASLALFEC